jgi:hypothetical protein
MFHPDIFSKNKSQQFLDQRDFAIADFSFAKRNVCILYPRFFMSTYELNRRLQPLAGL